MHHGRSDIKVDHVATTAHISHSVRDIYIHTETLLSYGEDAKSSHLESELYYKDITGAIEDMKADGENEGFSERYNYCKNSKAIDMTGRIHHNMFRQDKLLLNKADISITLSRSANEFSLLSSTKKEYKVVFKEAVLLVKRVTASDHTSSAIEKTLEKGRAKCTPDNIQCKDSTVPPGNHSLIEDRLFNGKIPNRVIVVFVDNDAFRGSYNANLYNFKYMNISEIGLSINGQPVPYSEPIKLHFNNDDTGEYLKAYALFTGTDMKCLDHGNNISQSDFASDYTIFPFNLAPDSETGEHLNL